MAEMAQCAKCGTTMDAKKNFYLKKDKTRTTLCKKCLTMNVDPFKEETYLWILEELDVPYIEEQWKKTTNKCIQKAQEDGKPLTASAIVGKYLSVMKLNHYKEYGYKDSEKLKVLREEKAQAAQINLANFSEELKTQYERGEISEAQYKTLSAPPTSLEEAHAQIVQSQPQSAFGGFYNENEYIKDAELPDPAEELTKEDKLYLVMKWGKLYKASELVELEKNYRDMAESFSVEDPDSKNTLILICKVTLKANQALDAGDYDGFNKLSRTLDTMRKSTKFTAAQNKEKSSNFLDSAGKLVDYCEREENGGPIPRFVIKEPLDKVDIIIQDLKNYNKELVNQDITLASQIEEYIKKREFLDAELREKKLNGGKTVDKEVTDEDYATHFENIEKQKAEDAALYEEGSDL